MFRRVGLSLLTVLMFPLFQGDALFADIINGQFNSSDPVEGWHYQWTSVNGEFEDHLTRAGSTGVLMNGFDESFTGLFQTFSVESGKNYLQFDLKFEFEKFSETEYFTAGLFDPSDDPDMNGEFIPSNATQFYSMSTQKLDREIFSSGVVVDIIEDYFDETGVTPNYSIRRILLPVLSGDTKIWFGLTGWDWDLSATAVIDQVDLTVNSVPVPTTMTLGLIGVGVVGAIRKKIR